MTSSKPQWTSNKIEAGSLPAVRGSIIQLNPYTGSLGAEILGLDLRNRVSDQAAADLRVMLSRYHVLFFRNQQINDEHHLALARVFGAIYHHPISQALGGNGVLHDIVDTKDRAPNRDGWHTEIAYLHRPPIVAVLRAVLVPSFGGDTVWSNTIDAFESLSSSMKAFLSGLDAFHESDPAVLKLAKSLLPEALVKDVLAELGIGAFHSLVGTHPDSGRQYLYLNKSTMRAIRGLTEGESKTILSFLFTLVHNPNWQCRFAWRPGDVVVWDQRTTQHFGVSDHRGQERVLRRCLVRGERPS